MSNDYDNLLSIVSKLAEKAHMRVLKACSYDERMTCPYCGEWIRRRDKSLCGCHPELPPEKDDDFKIRIKLVKAPESKY